MFPITLSNTANVLQRGMLIEMVMQPSQSESLFIHWLLSGFIHDNLLFSCRITLMRGLKGGVCVCAYVSVCVCGFTLLSCEGLLPREKGPHCYCLQLSPLFRRRGLIWFCTDSQSYVRKLPAIWRIQVSTIDVTINSAKSLFFLRGDGGEVEGGVFWFESQTILYLDCLNWLIELLHTWNRP